jgi:RHS repeat-associated protein
VSGIYTRGINLIKNSVYYYLYNAHGDVVQLTDESGAVTKDYHYDAFGVEIGKDETDTNPWRYCGEYWNEETNTYYLRARFYTPSTGRFSSEDTHWNPENMIYGDNPQKIGEKKDALGINIYTYKPDINAVRQSANLYVYGLNNPIYYVDPSGDLVWPGEIHNAVSDHIWWMQGFGNGRWLTPNKYVGYGFLKGFGFADLYDKKTGEVWEIKPFSYESKIKKRTAAEAQLQKYIDNIDGAKAGKSFGSESFYYFSFGKIVPLPQVYLVTFRSDNNGMIYYEYDEIVDGEKIAAALALLATWILSGNWNGSTVPLYN